MELVAVLEDCESLVEEELDKGSLCFPEPFSSSPLSTTVPFSLELVELALVCCSVSSLLCASLELDALFNKSFAFLAVSRVALVAEDRNLTCCLFGFLNLF